MTIVSRRAVTQKQKDNPMRTSRGLRRENKTYNLGGPLLVQQKFGRVQGASEVD